MRLLFSFYTVILLTGMGMFCSCDFVEKNKEKQKKQSYEASKKTIEEIERENPLRFISVNGKDKKNIIGQTVVKGTIINKATTVAYKNFAVKVSFYSKTGALLEEDEETIMEQIGPGDEFEFKSKFFAPRDAEEVKLKVISAKPVK
ncbi:MAG: hypothetical protein RIR96_471 [Bacteroidota bacterium]|jgi:hypothetical protein